SLSSDLAVLDLPTSAWTVTSGGDPGGRQKHTAAYHSDRGWTIVMGGTASASESYANLVWTFDGSTWGAIADGPAVMQSSPAVAVYDSADQAIIVFTGTQTWVLK
ncbi:MAG: hypothetical protein AAGD96_35015, partial [Chloroflexota bacterium]